MYAKKLFLKDKPLADKMAAVTHADWFRTALTFARAELMDLPNMTTENLVGATKYEKIILELADEEEDNVAVEAPKLLHHDLDDPKRKSVVIKESKPSTP